MVPATLTNNTAAESRGFGCIVNNLYVGEWRVVILSRLLNGMITASNVTNRASSTRSGRVSECSGREKKKRFEPTKVDARNRKTK